MGSYNNYPDPSESSFLTGVDCPYCSVSADKRCITKSGAPYAQLCHAKRKEAARAANITLTVNEPVVVVDPSVEGKVQSLKLAFWYIDKMGGVTRARAYFEAATAALENLPEEIEA